MNTSLSTQILPAIFSLILALNKHKIQGTTLMLVGAIMSIGGTVLNYLATSVIGYFEYFNFLQVFLMVINVLATLFFVIGVLQLINYLGQHRLKTSS